MTQRQTAIDEPTEAVLTEEWNGHRLFYIEALLVAAKRQNRRILLILDKSAAQAPNWDRIESLLEAHWLLQVDFATTTIEECLPASVKRLVVLEADAMLTDVPRLLRRNKGLMLSLLVMREPGFKAAGSAARSTVVTLTKAALVAALVTSFRSRCEIHILRSALFPPSLATRVLCSSRHCVSILDPLLGSGKAKDAGVQPAQTPIALVIGRLDARKSLDELLPAWTHPSLAGYRLDLRGEVDHENFDALVHSAISAGADISVLDRHLTDDEMGVAFDDASAALCLYTSGLPSGIAALALEAGCPVIGFAHTKLGAAIVRNRLGAVVNSADAPQLVNALNECRDLSRIEVQRTARSLQQLATTERFSAQLLDIAPRSGDPSTTS